MKIASHPPIHFQGRKQDKDWQDAGKLMELRGVPREDHQFMQENLATYLSHRSGRGELSARWQHKVDRELNKPFTDEKIGERLDFLQQSLLEKSRSCRLTPVEFTSPVASREAVWAATPTWTATPK